MPYIFVKADTHKRLNLFKAKKGLKSHDKVIRELFNFWEVMPFG